MKSNQFLISKIRSVVLLFILPGFLFGWQNPANPHGDRIAACETCHTSSSWTELAMGDWTHEDTGFELVEAHNQLACKACHESLVFKNVGTNCADCHTDAHKGELGHDCARCHQENSWEPAIRMLEHHNGTLFPLLGVHAQVDCEACHQNQQRMEFSGTPVECEACHQQDYLTTDNPSHQQAGFGRDCLQCHLPADPWDRAVFEHPASFPLNAGHGGLSCADCHDQRYVGLSTDCVSCHQNDYNTTANPAHGPAGFSVDCMACHTTAAWSPANFDHNQTGFPLVGSHGPLDCLSCHSAGYNNTPTDCIGCHDSDFKGVTNPNHVASGFSTDCTLCHNQNTWLPADFDHNQTQFPLTGAHRSLDCLPCHDKGYTNTPTDCIACHRTDYDGVIDPNHVSNNFSTDCTFCHTDAAWTPATFDHNQTQFPLTGAHSPLDCLACHEQGYQNTPTDCIACHRSDFDGVTDPNHVTNNFSTDCTQCHTDTAWTPASFDHNQTQFPLTGAHSPLDCLACHQQGYQNTPTDCIACHRSDFDGVTDPNHVTNNFSTDCTQCHTDTAWTPASFDHNQTQFPLTGAHSPLDCLACHEQGYQNTPTDCIACHRDNFNGVTDPNHVTNNFSTDCTQCHTDTAWTPASFDHNQTQFPLTGAHSPLDCLACHQQGYQNTPTDCIACHRSDFDGVTDPNHVTNNFSTDCTQCHTDTAWTPASFDHNQTQFPLTGAHSPLDCLACHEQGYQNTPTDCIACHRDNFNAVTDPNHVTNNFSTDCTQCHTDTAWTPATFDHNQTQFPLTGAHSPLDCLACHEQGYVNTPTDCIACHRDNFNGVTDPNHVTNNFSTDCTQCHTDTAWTPATFDHNQTQFPLTGAHSPLDCLACHEQGYVNTPTDCIACHRDNFNAVTDPNHVTNNFSTDCTQCHTDTAWTPATFDHNQTQFPLTGAHSPLDCLACHEQGYQNTPTDCIACHRDDFNGVTDPNHVTNNFSTDCTQCHTDTAWTPATFDHNQTQFPLTGAHSPLDCLACHEQGYQNTPTDCIACHRDDFNGVTDPNHVTNNFSTDCTQCHTDTAWTPATFDHNQTQFPLTGAHSPLDCLACHEQGYQNTPTDCIACHRDDFNGVTDPNHVTNNFSTDCTQCHTDTAWSPATFDHNATQFPLTGAHSPLDCLACHSQGYNNTPTDCISCHREDYNGVTDPNHVANNFSTDCTQCHTDTAWIPATFDHNQTGFPLVGAHRSLNCIECHDQGYNNTPTNCIDCHRSDYDGVIDPNHRTNNFSQDCTLCHSQTAWSPATFEHNQTQFPLTGAHRNLDCLACHDQGYNNTPTDCIACHRSDYNGADPNHIAAGFPTDCTLCHNTSDWDQVNWDHDGSYFPIFSDKHQGKWDTCNDCHIGGVFTNFECIQCHAHNQADMADEHDEVGNYVWQSPACFNCHPDGRE